MSTPGTENDGIGIGSPDALRSAPVGFPDASSEEWSEAYQLLAREGQLLDDHRYDEWSDLYTEDCVYWVPIRRDDPDPERDVSIAYDDHGRMRERIERMRSGFMYAQDPPSRTSRLMGSVQVWRAGEGALQVRSSFVVTELRRERRTVYSGTAHHMLRSEEGRLRISRKTVLLVDSDSPLGNLTFIL